MNIWRKISLLQDHDENSVTMLNVPERLERDLVQTLKLRRVTGKLRNMIG
jgi:hypothetical protein